MGVDIGPGKCECHCLVRKERENGRTRGTYTTLSPTVGVSDWQVFLSIKTWLVLRGSRYCVTSFRW